MLTLDIWSDIVCPWCFIGKRRLEKALASLPGEDVQIHWRAFELQPQLPPEGVEAKPFYAQKFGGEERMKLLFKRVEDIAAGDGLHFDRSKLQRVPNTFLAHQVVKAAEAQGQGAAVVEALFSGHHEHGVYVGALSNIEAWLKERKVALDYERLEQDIEAGRFADEVRADERESARLGIHGVPFFLANRRVALSGAGEPEDLARLLVAAKDENILASSPLPPGEG